MAKKKASSDSFNMSLEVRNLLTADPKLSNREALEQLQAKFPGQEINRNSYNVAFSQARRKLGLRRGSKRAVKIQRPAAAARVAKAAAASSSENISLELLKAARKLLSEAGSSSAAISAIQQVEALQLN